MQQQVDWFRTKNLFREALGPSVCFFRLNMAAGSELCAETLNWFNNETQVLNAQARVSSLATAVQCELEVSHGTLDAFGGMYLLSELDRTSQSGTSTPADLAEHVATGVMSKSGQVGENVWSQYVARIPKRSEQQNSFSVPSNSRTLTQKILAKFFDTVPEMSSLSWGMVAALDPVAEISRENYRGNSLVILEIHRDEFARLSNADKKDWALYIQSKAERLRKMVTVRPQLAKPVHPEILVSSVGDLARIPWAKNLYPSSFVMIPTPIGVSTANLVLWGNGPEQALAVCGNAQHPLVRGRDVLVESWRSLIENESLPASLFPERPLDAASSASEQRAH